MVNQTWTGVPTLDPVLGSLARAEAPWLHKVLALAERVVRIPWQARAPKGLDGLAQLLHGSREEHVSAGVEHPSNAEKTRGW